MGMQGDYGMPPPPMGAPPMMQRPIMKKPMPKARAVKKKKMTCSHCGGAVGCKKCGAEMQ